MLPGVSEPDDVLAAARSEGLTHVVLEGDALHLHVDEFLTKLYGIDPSIGVIALGPLGRVSGGTSRALPRTASPDQIAELVQPGLKVAPSFVLSAVERSGDYLLTPQQLRVLALLSLGMTVSEIALRLGLSQRSVAKSKATIFAKLGVQSQAQAVAAAMGVGLLGPLERRLG